MKKWIIILSVIIAYLLIGILVFRDTVNTEIAFAQFQTEEYQIIAGKTLQGSYHVGEVTIYENNSEIYRYQTHYQNSLYRDVIVDNNIIYLLGYQFSSDNIITSFFITMIDSSWNVEDQKDFSMSGEIYPKRIVSYENSIFVISSFSGNQFEEYNVQNQGEYDLLLIKFSKDLLIQSVYSYGENLSELVSDALILNGKIYISLNYFDSLVSGNIEESNQGKLISFDLENNLFQEESTVLSENKNRIQGLVLDDQKLYYFGNQEDQETMLMTPYLCELGESFCMYINDLETNGNVFDAAIHDGEIILVLQMEHYAYSEIYGDITRRMLYYYQDAEEQIVSIDDEVYIERIYSENGIFSVVGYQIKNNIIKADVTEYYYEQLDFNVMND